MVLRYRTRILAAVCVWVIAIGTAIPAHAPAFAEDSTGPETPVTVFAAASLTDVLGRIGALYEDRNGQPIRFSFAASSTLARQIETGAPAQIFASANERWMDHVAEDGLIEPGSRTSPIGNSLVLIAPTDSPLGDVVVDAALDWGSLIGEGERIAMADPDHTPVGLYAREALESLGLWTEVEDLLARTADVRAALALVGTGEAPLGLVYATDAAASDRVRIVGRVPEEAHTPISYPFAVIAGQGGADVAAVFAFLTGPEARPVFEEAGFTVQSTVNSNVQ